jgi:hypothetical protein
MADLKRHEELVVIAAKAIEEIGRMVGGWRKSSASKGAFVAGSKATPEKCAGSPRRTDPRG